MPLYNVMNRGLRLPRIGTIRKGVQVPVLGPDGKPKKGRNGIVTRPKEMPYFIFKCAESTANPGDNIEAELYNLYGTKEIRELNVFLAYPEAEQNFSFWLEAYTNSQLVARSDERVITYLYDVETNQTLIRDAVVIEHSTNPNSPAGKIANKVAIGQPVPHTPDLVLGETKESRNPITFKAVGRLTVVIRELRRLATFTLITGGYWYDIPQIYSTIQIVKDICNATGRGANTIPLILRRTEVEGTYTDDSGAKKKKMRHDVELEIRPDITRGLLESYNDSPFALALEQGHSGQPVLAANVGDVDEEFTDAISAEAVEEGMSYIDAKQVTVKVRGVEKFVGELDEKQLRYLVDNAKTDEQRAAALVVLAHEHPQGEA
jgi:hypothetical protein